MDIRRPRHIMIYAVALAIGGLLSTYACSSGKGGDASGVPVLTVSIEPQRRMLEEIAGDSFRVVTLLPPGSNPETFEPTVNRRLDIDRSAAFFTTGLLPYETTIASSLGEGVKVVDTSRGIKLIYGTHHHGHSHGDGHHDHAGHSHSHGDADPHVWTSVRNARVMMHNMLDALIAINPAGEEYFTARYNAAVSRLDSLDRAFATQLADADKAFAVWHPSLTYFARDYGLEQIAVGQESKEVSPRQLREISSRAKDANVKVFFFQREYDSRQAESINSEIGSRLVSIDPTAYEWEQQLTEIVNQLKQ